jgi:hypothetical protein
MTYKIETDDEINLSLTQSSKLLDEIFDPEDLIEIRTIDPDGKVYQEWFPAGEWINNHEGFVRLNNADHNIFFGINPRTKKSGSADAIEIARSLIVDLDDTPAEELLKRCDKELGVTPTITWNTGGGGQAVIVLEEAVPIDRWCRLQRGVIAAIPGADASIKDAPRIMRLPGFYNRKSKYAPDYPMATIIDENPNWVYPANDFPEGNDFKQTLNGDPIPQVPLPYEGYLPRKAIDFLENGTLFAADGSGEPSRRMTAFSVACAARGPDEEPNIPRDEILEKILERLMELGLEGKDLEDIERQVDNAYSLPREVNIDPEDLPEVKLPKKSGKPEVTFAYGEKDKVFVKVRASSRFHTDQIDVTREDHRSKFLKGLKNRFGDSFDTSDIEEQLHQLAAGEIEIPAPEFTPIGAPASDDELEPGSTIRPERWIARSGDSVSSAFTVGVRRKSLGGLLGQWVSYVAKDDNREALILPATLNLEDRVFHIEPAELGDPPNTKHTWSKGSRQSWIDSGRDEMKPKDLFDRILEMLSHFIDFDIAVSGDMLPVLGVFAAATYCTPAFKSYAYLNFSGPFGSGKSRVLEVLHEIVHRPAMTANLTPAVLFRKLDQMGCCFLLDEAERISDIDIGPLADIRGIFLMGYRQGGVVERCVGDEHTPTLFRVDGFKALAAQNPLDSTLSSRCVRTYMTRCPAKSPLIHNNPSKECFEPEWQSLRNALFTWAINRGPQLLDLIPGDDIVPKSLSPRSQEIWTSLFQLAHLFESEGVSGLVDTITAVALKKEESLKITSITEVELSVLRAAVELGQKHREDSKMYRVPTSKDIATKASIDSREIYPKTAAKILRSFGFDDRPLDGRSAWDMPAARVLTVQDRYSLDLGMKAQKSAEAVSPKPLSPLCPLPDQESGSTSGQSGQSGLAESVPPAPPPKKSAPKAKSKKKSKNAKNEKPSSEPTIQPRKVTL